MHSKINFPTTRGGVEDTRLDAKDTKKSKAKDSPSEDRHSRGQGQECSRTRLRTKDTGASVFQKKGPQNFFQAFSKKRSSKIFFGRSTKF